MNSQPRDPSIEAITSDVDAAEDEAAAASAPSSHGPAEAPVLLRPDGTPRGGGNGANRGRRLHAVQSVPGQGARQGQGRGARAAAAQAPHVVPSEAFAPEPAVQPAAPTDPQPVQPSPQVPQYPRPAQLAQSIVVRPAASPAKLGKRHYGIAALALLMIIVPGIATAVYMWGYAQDQYVSTAGFAIRTETNSSPLDFLSAFGGGSTTTSKDMDILNNFIGSQQLVQKLDQQLDLKAIYSKPKNDPLFSYNTGGTIEDLVDYWNRVVIVNYDNTTGLMQLHVSAFTPDDAQRIAQAVLAESSDVVNKLAAISRDDTTRYAKTATDEAEAKLKDARAALTAFRVANNIVDPTIDISAQSSVVGSLTQELVQTQVELATLKQGATSANDPRMNTLQNRIDIIQARITEEQSKVGAAGGTNTKGYAEIVATYERLSVDSEFAEKAYLTALASFDVAQEDASHKQVYLATYEEPTLAEASTSPRRWLILMAVMVIGFLSWSIVTLIYYALRDRR